jgi:CRISPR/Cas system CSM-associated protein Csm3 (group 7 of RAMP superfamily)
LPLRWQKNVRKEAIKMTTIKATKYKFRHLARVIIEAKTPIAVGSGEKDVITDALVATDVNGLPYIPGTALAGVVRSMIGEEKSRKYFGYQEGSKKGQGSEIIFTEAKILNSKGEVIDGLNIKAIDDELLMNYKELPIRQHVNITDKGVAKEHGKFDEQIVFAGTRFSFELEMVSGDKEDENFKTILSQLLNNTFRIGSGTRNGFGEVEVIDLQKRSLDLSDANNLKDYLDKSSALNSDFWSKDYSKPERITNTDEWTEYKLALQPDDFFLFGSGFGDDEADMTPVKGKKVNWSSGKGVLEENLVLIPATSVKGALSHRVAFYYNKLKGFCVREKDGEFVRDKEAECGNKNIAVQTLFGYESQDEKIQQRGNLIFSDIIEKKETKENILNHVSIDRFTGGAIEGALFTEKTSFGKGQTFEMSILAKKDALKDNDVKNALENALKDICSGMLPLGGGVNRGNGVFKESVTKNGEPLQ